MRPAIVRSAVALTLALLAAGTAPAAAGPHRPDRPDRPPVYAGHLVSARPMTLSAPLVAVGARGLRLAYLSTSDDGAPRLVTGLLIVPPGRAPAGGWPVASWAHGTTGSADACAPSRLPDLGGYDSALAGLVRAGYAVAATDYEGLGSPGPHAYLISRSEAHGVIDVVRAARQTGLGLSDRWIGIGHSQGSQAVLKAGEIDGSYGRGLHLLGTAAFGAAVNLADTLATRLHNIEGDFGSQAYYLLILGGEKALHPQLDYADYLGPTARTLVPKIETSCLVDLAVEFSQLNLPASEFQPRNPAALHRIEQLIGREAVPMTRAARPAITFYGTADEIVSPPEAQASLARSCALGTTAYLKVYPGVNHDGVVPTALGDALSWMHDRFAGRPAPSSC